MRHIDEIVIHCTATPAGWRADETTAQKAAEVRRWHVEDNGWHDVGYHFLIDRDGTVVEGRPVEQAGAHVGGHNDSTIGIALFGGRGSHADDTPGDHYTPAQMLALRQLCLRLIERHPTIEKVRGHNDYAARACPGFRVARWWRRGRTAPKPRTGFARFIEWLMGFLGGRNA